MSTKSRTELLGEISGRADFGKLRFPEQLKALESRFASLNISEKLAVLSRGFLPDEGDALRANIAELTAKVETLIAEKTDVETLAMQRATEIAAKVGVHPVKTNAKDGSIGTVETIDQVKAMIVKETDPRKRGQLVVQLNELQGRNYSKSQ